MVHMRLVRQLPPTSRRYRREQWGARWEDASSGSAEEPSLDRKRGGSAGTTSLADAVRTGGVERGQDNDSCHVLVLPAHDLPARYVARRVRRFQRAKQRLGQAQVSGISGESGFVSP